jgi:hypothetical protein
MTTIYEDTIYEYLTIPENYKSTESLLHEFKNVTERLISEFWSELKEFIKKKTQGEGWGIEENGLEGVNDIFLKQDAWKGIFVVLNPDVNGINYCIYIIDGQLDRVEINKLADANTSDLGEVHCDMPWLCWESKSDYGISLPLEPYKILPTYRIAKIESIASDFISYANRHKSLCDEFNTMKK